jgi:signal transduction histidine kinase
MILVAIVFFSVNTYLSRTTVKELASLQQHIRNSSKIINIYQQIHVALLTAQSSQREFYFTQNSRYLNEFNKSIKKINTSIAQSNALYFSEQTQNKLFNQLVALIKTQQVNMQNTVDKVLLGQAVNPVKSTEIQLADIEIQRAFVRLKDNEQTINSNLVDLLKKSTRESQSNFIISFLISFALIIGIFLLARVNMKSQIERQIEVEQQNQYLKKAVDERTKELSLFSEELTRSNRELEDFAFVASHDLQEPLRKIMAFGDRLDTQSDNLTDKQRDYLQRMCGAASRMSKLISDLLEFSRISTRGKDFQEVELGLIFQDCIDDLNVLIEETQAQISIDEMPTIDADPTQMQQLFFNLLANAIKFSQHENTPNVNISIKQTTQPADIELEGLSQWFTITVTDNGIGFSQEYADKIFAPFQRLHSRQQYKGTGIGLAICRRVVERHNGIIMATSEPGKGAAFTVTLPAKNFLNSIKQ